MRVTTLVNKLIGLQGLWVRGFHFQADKARVVVDVVPRRRKPLCGICGRKVRKNKDRYNRYWRHLDLFGVRTYLRYSIRRVVCRRCGVVREKVPWADKGSRFTKSFEQEVAWLAQKRFSCRFGGDGRCRDCGKRRKLRAREAFRERCGQRKGALGRQGKPLYQKLRTRGSVAGTEDERQRRSELFPSDVAFGATDHQRVVAEQRDERRELDGLRVIGMDEISYRKRHKYLTLIANKRHRV